MEEDSTWSSSHVKLGGDRQVPRKLHKAEIRTGADESRVRKCALSSQVQPEPGV